MYALVTLVPFDMSNLVTVLNCCLRWFFPMFLQKLFGKPIHQLMIDNFQFFAFAFLVMIPHGSPEKSKQNLSHTTYSKSRILVQKFNLTSFSPKFFLTLCLVKSKLSTAKKSKTTTFSRVFHPKKIDTFSREIKVVNS